MSTFDLAYLAMVIAAMAAFLLALAWGCWRTRSPARRIPAAEQAPVVQAIRPAGATTHQVSSSPA